MKHLTRSLRKIKDICSNCAQLDKQNNHYFLKINKTFFKWFYLLIGHAAWHVELSSLSKDGDYAPFIGSMES